MTPAAAARVHQSWAARATTEYATGALSAELLHLLAVVGVSPDTLERVQRVTADEFRHARICRAVYEAAGGPDEAFAVDPRTLRSPIARDRPPGEQALVRVTLHLAIGESLAVPLFQALRAHATVPVACEALDTFLVDDAFHAAVGWDALEELIERWGDEGRATLRPWIPGLMQGAWRRYQLTGPDLPTEVRAWGLMRPQRFAEVSDACLRGTVSKRLTDLGLLDGPWAP